MLIEFYINFFLLLIFQVSQESVLDQGGYKKMLLFSQPNISFNGETLKKRKL